MPSLRFHEGAEIIEDLIPKRITHLISHYMAYEEGPFRGQKCDAKSALFVVERLKLVTTGPIPLGYSFALCV